MLAEIETYLKTYKHWPESIGGDTLTCKELVELRGPTFDPLDDGDLFN